MGFIQDAVDVLTGFLGRTPEVTVSDRFRWTGYTRVRNIIVLLEAIVDCYDDSSLQPKDGQTFCNVAAGRIATAMGCKDFAAKTADQIFDLVKISPDWEEVQMAQCQTLANQGSLVFAIANSTMLTQEHGHIACIRPGMPKPSGKWGSCPSVMNIGGVNFIARAKSGPLIGMPVGVNESFVPEPKFYAWKPSL